jgi:ubiquinone/menaquinone biosynthesis C-methylase UbiE
MTGEQETIAEAFSRTAERYDAFGENHPHLTRLRGKVYSHLEGFLAPQSRILELNAGSGVDAVHLAQQGHFIHAIDISAGMLDRLRGKVDRLGLGDQITIQECSFTELRKVQGGPYDAVFSDMGGLNCIPNPTFVIQSLPEVLRPGGLVTWVLMPPVCLWELAEIFRLHPQLAVRRFSPNGTLSHLEGLHFKVYYFSPREVLGWFGADYQFLRLEGLSVITPTTESKNLAKQFPRLYRALTWLDDRLAPHRPWSGWGDFYILSLRYLPKSG